MGKKSKGNESAMVNVAKDIKKNKGTYANTRVVDSDNKNDTQTLEDMMHQYDSISKKLKEKQETPMSTIDDDTPRKTTGRLNDDAFYWEEPAPTKGDIIIGGIVMGVLVAGVIAIGYVGWKGYKVIRRFV